MIGYIEMITKTVDGKIGVILTILALLLIIDFVIGVIHANINKDIKFTSYKMKTGIMVKLTEFILCVIAIPFALFIDGGIELLIVGFIGLCIAEVYSILETLKVVNGGQSNTAFETFMKSIFKGGK